MNRKKSEGLRKIAAKRQQLLGNNTHDVIMVTGGRKSQSRPAGLSLRDLDPKTVEILVEDKIATGG